MAVYQPINIKANEVGLVQNRQEFILPQDAYPILENAFIFREQIRRRQGYRILGRLQRNITIADQTFSASDPALFSGNLFALGSITEPNAQISPGSVSMQTIALGPHTYYMADQNEDGNILTISGSSIGYYGNITGVTVGATTTITFPSSNSLATGNIVYISGINSPGPTSLNGQYWTVQSSTAGNFVINANTTGSSAWTSGGLVQYVFGTVNYLTSAISLSANGAFAGSTISNIVFGYYPNLSAMGIRIEEQDPNNEENTIFFDTKYAYVFDSVANAFKEFIPGTTWNGTDSQFFWSTNYWTTDVTNAKLFWATNFNWDQAIKDPIRYTDGVSWDDFSPGTGQGQLDETGTLFLLQALCLLPFRGRLLAFNTIEGSALGAAGVKNYSNRIRWSQIGNPLTPYSAGPPVAGSWLDTVRGKGGFLDIPTNEDIITVGFVRDNLVIYCENSTWQLRYTGRSIAPFQIEKVNSELGVKSTFSGIQFDTDIKGVGNRGIIECDSYQSQRFDIKIPDLVFQFNNNQVNNQNIGARRVHGYRDFIQKLAYWIYPNKASNGIFPDRRLVYNYENDSWAIFTDSLTCMGTYNPTTDLTWENSDVTWEEANFTWIDKPSETPQAVGGNQQGYIEYIGGSVEGAQTTNDESLYIKNITGFGILPSDNPVSVSSPAHNMQTGQIIQIIDILPSDPFYTYLNDGIFQVTVVDADNFYLTVYDPLTLEYSAPALAPSGTYLGAAQIKVRDNFRVVSKKFNYMDQGKQFQLGWVDILMDATDDGAISMNIYTDYNVEASNIQPQNQPIDTFFNSVIPTNAPEQSIDGGTKNWMRVICPTNSNFVTIEYTLNNEQMQNQCQESDVQIDAQILYARPGGRQGITR